MSTNVTGRVETANDAMKARFTAGVWRGIAAAAVLHFAVLALTPRMTVADLRRPGVDRIAIDIPPRFEIPPPPDEPRRPAVPVPGDVSVDPAITIDPHLFDDQPPPRLPEPPRGNVDVSDRPAHTPYEVRPEFRNPDDYLRALERRYPPLLRDAGLGGTVVLWVHIDEAGAVVATRVMTSSGYPEMDAVAEEVMREVASFRPALNRDRRVAVWIQIPVTFRVR